MHPRVLCFTALAMLATAAPAVAAPVYVSPRVEGGAVPTDTTVVAFSYDVRRVFPGIEARFAKWKPKPPSQSGKIPLLPTWNDYTLVHARQLQDFRAAFRRAHQGEDEIMKVLAPKFDEVYKKFGENPPEPETTDQLAVENPRQIWCQKVTMGVNKAISEYTNNGVNGSPETAYRVTYARWLGQRNEALRLAANQAGGHPDINFMEGATNEGGLATFDLPPGDWWIACETNDGRAWYKQVRVGAKGGHVILDVTEARTEGLNLTQWTGN